MMMATDGQPGFLFYFPTIPLKFPQSTMTFIKFCIHLKNYNTIYVIFLKPMKQRTCNFVAVIESFKPNTIQSLFLNVNLNQKYSSKRHEPFTTILLDYIGS